MIRTLTRRITLAAIVATLALAVSLSAITPPKITFTDTKLSNGLRLIVAEDHVAPVFSIAVVYNVGSRDERKGRTGFAHLFEHMMFKGSENVGPGEHFYTVFSNGGTMNGTTNKERTLYFETMPANQLEAGIYLESPAQLLNYYVTRWRFALAADYWDRYPERVSAVTAQQIQAAARTYLAANRMQIVAVGDPARVADTLRKLGEVETYDADGKRVSL